jgi:curved DNA-binding protein
MNEYGEAQASLKTIKVKIPKGARAGRKIRLKGQGAQGVGGGPNGDLLLEVHLNPHPYFTVDGGDLYFNLPITPWEAALGAHIRVPTFSGDIELKIPAGSKSGKKLRLKGRGLPNKISGDLYIVLQIETPPADSEHAIQFYQRMATEFSFQPRQTIKI